MTINIEKDKNKILRITLLPISILVFYTIQLVTSNHLDQPLLGINRIYFYIPALLIFSAFVIFNLITYFSKDYKIEIGEKFYAKTSMSKGIELNWNDIEAFQLIKRNQIGVILKEPQDFIEAETNSMLTKIYKRNLKITGSPYIISPNLLKLNLNRF